MKAKCMMNLTPNAVGIYGDEGLIASFPPSGTVARVAEEREACPPVAIGLTVIDVSRATYGAVQGLPAPDGETMYIVSAQVLAQCECAGRTDVYAPGPDIRDYAGRVIGCHGLSAAPAQAEAEMLYAAWEGGANGYAPPARPERTWDDRDHACK